MLLEELPRSVAPEAPEAPPTVTRVPVCPQFVVHEAPGQELDVELYDEDTDKDDFLGRLA